MLNELCLGFSIENTLSTFISLFFLLDLSKVVSNGICEQKDADKPLHPLRMLHSGGCFLDNAGFLYLNTLFHRP